MTAMPAASTNDVSSMVHAHFAEIDMAYRDKPAMRIEADDA